MDRGSLLAVDAALQAAESAGIARDGVEARRTAVADGITYRAPGQATLFVPYGQMVARALGVRGPVVVESGAEASGLSAIASAARIIARDEADIVLAGAAQSLQRPLLDHLRAQGFASKTAPHPFDAAHNGMLPAEAAAYVVVESEKHARKRGATIHGRIAGIGHAFDPQTEPLAISTPTEAGRAMQAALTDAGYIQNQVDLYVSSADGRPALDDAEGYAVKRIFGRHAYYAGVTTAAGALGNALAASGPLSVVLALTAFARQQSFPIGGLETPVPDFELTFLRTPQKEKLDCILLTSLGVGGTNIALVLNRE